MKGILGLFVMAALVAGFNANAKHCVSKKNANGVMVTTCDGKVVPKKNVERKSKCEKTTGPDGKTTTKCKSMKKARR